MCAIKFIRLEDYLEDKAVTGEMLPLDPQGYVFAEVRPQFSKLGQSLIRLLY